MRNGLPSPLGGMYGLGGQGGGRSLAQRVAAIFQTVPGFWLSPSLASTLFEDAGGTNPAESGDNILNATDRSGGGNTFTSTDATTGPLYTSPNKLTFASGDFLSFPQAAIGSDQPFEVFAAVMLSANGSNPGFISPVSSGDGFYMSCSGATRLLRVAATGGTGGTAAVNSSRGALNVNERYVVGARVGASALFGFVNGAQVSTISRTGTFGSPAAYRIGFNAAGANLPGDIYAMMGFRGALTDEQRTDVLDFLLEISNAYRAITLGDSTVGAYLGTTALLDFTDTVWQKSQLAVPGNTIAQQKTAWLAQANGRAAKWIIVQAGLNDLDTAEAAPVAIARLQDLVDTVSSERATTSRLLISQMIPCRARLIALYGGVGGPIAYQKWLDMNEAIAGNGPNPITGVDGRVTAHVPLMNDGSGNLLPTYDTGDGIHPNDAGRMVNAQAYVDALMALGLTV